MRMRTRSNLDKVCERLRITIECKYGEHEPNFDWSAWPQGVNPYRVTLKKGKRRLTTYFYQGPALTEEPTPADVLSCLCSDARAGEQDFEDFCSDFGYDTDSRKAEKTWRACKATAPRVRRFLGDDWDTVANAEH